MGVFFLNTVYLYVYVADNLYNVVLVILKNTRHLHFSVATGVFSVFGVCIATAKVWSISSNSESGNRW